MLLTGGLPTVIGRFTTTSKVHPPELHLQSRKELWRDRQQIDITSRWRVFWWSAGGQIHYLDRPTI